MVEVEIAETVADVDPGIFMQEKIAQGEQQFAGIIFVREVSVGVPPFPPDGPMGFVPCITGTMRALRRLASHFAAFRFLQLAIPSLTLIVMVYFRPFIKHGK